MPDALHDRHAAARDRSGHRLGHRRSAGVVVLASEQRHAALAGIDALDVLARVPVEAVVMDVAGIDTGTALAVIPPVLALRCFGTGRRAQPGCIARAKLPALG